MTITLSALQKQRYDTAANWTAENPTLLAGEIGVESDTGKIKIGTGSTAWTSLSYSGLIPGSGVYPYSQLLMPSGTAGAPSISFDGDANLGIYRSGTDQISITTAGTERFRVDSAGAATFNNAVTIQGDLTVNGTTTTIDTQNLIVEDKNVIIGNVTTPTDVTADGGGITLKGTTDKTINWVDATDAWTLSEHVNIASGKEYRIAGTKVLDATSLGSSVLITSANITDGTIVNGDINASAAIAGTKISPDFGSQNAVTTGTSTAASFIPSSSTVPTNGVYLAAANSVAISANSSERLRITSDGKVGLGTSSPSYRIHSGIDLGTQSPSTRQIGAVIGASYTRSDNSAFVGRRIALGAIGYAALIQGEDNGGNATDISINPVGGNVGVGTASPGNGAILHANGAIISTTATLSSFNFDNTGFDYSSNNGRFFATATGASGGSLTFTTGNNGSYNERARIDSSGRLLVGTSSARANFFNSTISSAFQLEGAGITPAQRFLSVVNNYATDGDGGGVISLCRSKGGVVGSDTLVGSAAGDQLGAVNFQGNDGTEFVVGARIEAYTDGTCGANDLPTRLVFSTTADGASSPTEAMRINNGQELLIGYTTDNGAYKLQVNSQIFATSAIIATSDGRYKENVATLEGCVDLVKALRPVSFDWKLQKDITRIDDEGNEILVREGHNFPDGTQVGFIAQEVQEVLADKPWLGSVIKQNVRSAVTDNNGNELAPEEKFLGIAEGNLIAVLTSALQEAIGEIESLKARVAALESA